MKQNLLSVIGVTVLLFAGSTGATAQPSRQYAAGPSGIVRHAEQGDVRAQTRLGVMLESGRDIAQNYVEAAYWYRRAAEQGDPDAQYRLGNCFRFGLGVQGDLVLAHKWLNLSSSHTRGREEREHRVKLRDAIATILSEPALKEAQSLAIAWRPKRER
jgi:hypothetical protein